MCFEQLQLKARFVIHDTWGRPQLRAGASYCKVAKWHAREVEWVNGRWQLRQGAEMIRIAGGHPVEEKKD